MRVSSGQGGACSGEGWTWHSARQSEAETFAVEQKKVLEMSE